MRVVGLILALLLVIGVGEVAVRRNRRRRAELERLKAHGLPIVGTVVGLRRVSAGKYGAYKWAATISYNVVGEEYRIVEQWWPDDNRPTQEGSSIDLVVDAADPKRAMVTGGSTPSVESDRFWRIFEVVLSVGAIIAFVLA